MSSQDEESIAMTMPNSGSNHSDQMTIDEAKDPVLLTSADTRDQVLYKIDDVPPWGLTILFAFQVRLI